MATTVNPLDVYTKRITKFKNAYTLQDKKFKRLAIFRLTIFIATFILVVYFANERWLDWSIIAFGLALITFFVIQKKHNKTQFLRSYFNQLIQINKKETLRLNLDLSPLDNGEEFADANHPYTADLNIFGPYSLFQLLNRTTTEFCKATLITWLGHPASRAVIHARQQAVKELAEKLSWRQELQALGAVFLNVENSIKDLVRWMRQPVDFGPKKRGQLTLIRLLVTLLSSAALAYFFFNIKTFLVSLVSPSSHDWVGYILPMLVIGAVNFFILRRFKMMAEDIILKSKNSPSYLLGLKKLFSHLEKEAFQASLLADLQAVYVNGPKPASEMTHRLHNVLDLFHLRGTAKGTMAGSAVYAMLNQLFLLDVYCLVALDKWKEGHGKILPTWVESLGELEALSSIAGLCFSNPEFVFPTITDQPQHLNFSQVGHPLIPAEKRVCNDFILTGKGDIGLITGSNMAGKSTFLRTLGINCVLAFMGAPVCSGKATVSEFHIFTSMRTQDDLAEGVSSFYAELRRIKQLLDYVEEKKQVFFLLDEVLKGTNSTDKHKGTMSLVRQLAATAAFGLVTTHDLTVGKLLENNTHIKNYSFQSSIEGEEIAFDYRIKDDICREFNASQLMKTIGINI